MPAFIVALGPLTGAYGHPSNVKISNGVCMRVCVCQTDKETETERERTCVYIYTCTNAYFLYITPSVHFSCKADTGPLPGHLSWFALCQAATVAGSRLLSFCASAFPSVKSCSSMREEHGRMCLGRIYGPSLEDSSLLLIFVIDDLLEGNFLRGAPLS